MTAIADTGSGPLIRWHDLGYSALTLAVMTAAIVSHERWFLNFVRRPDPDFDKISRMMRNFFFAVAIQGTMQVLTIIIMARFVSGL
jgi:hypothetical protein